MRGIDIYGSVMDTLSCLKWLALVRIAELQLLTYIRFLVPPIDAQRATMVFRLAFSYRAHEMFD